MIFLTVSTRGLLPVVFREAEGLWIILINLIIDVEKNPSWDFYLDGLI